MSEEKFKYMLILIHDSTHKIDTGNEFFYSHLENLICLTEKDPAVRKLKIPGLLETISSEYYEASTWLMNIYDKIHKNFETIFKIFESPNPHHFSYVKRDLIENIRATLEILSEQNCSFSRTANILSMLSKTKYKKIKQETETSIRYLEEDFSVLTKHLYKLEDMLNKLPN